VVSKIRVTLVMLALFALAVAVIVLLVAMRADAIWYKILPLSVLFFGTFTAQSLGWFNKKSRD
jgi:hypothetical protein